MDYIDLLLVYHICVFFFYSPCSSPPLLSCRTGRSRSNSFYFWQSKREVGFDLSLSAAGSEAGSRNVIYRRIVYRLYNRLGIKIL